MRCTSCGHSWFQRPEASSSPPPPPAAASPPRPAAARPVAAAEMAGASAARLPEPDDPAESAGDDLFEPAPRRGGSGFGWFLLAVFLIILVGSVFTMRGEIVRIWPPAIKLYEVLKISLDLPGSGLRIEAVRPQRDGAKVLVEGIVVNVSAQPRDIPPMKVEIYNDPKQILATSRLKLDVVRLDPGQGASFRHEIDGVPPLEINVRLTFDPVSP